MHKSAREIWMCTICLDPVSNLLDECDHPGAPVVGCSLSAHVVDRPHDNHVSKRTAHQVAPSEAEDTNAMSYLECK